MQSEIILSYKLKLFPTRNKADCLAGLTELFQRAHSDCTSELSQPGEFRPFTCPSTVGKGEFVGRAYRRAWIDANRTLKASLKTGRPFHLPRLQADLIDSADIQLPKQAKHFDYWVLIKGTKDKLYIPAKGHRGLNRGLALPGAKLHLGTKGSAEVFRKNGKWYARVYVKVPQPEAYTPQGWLGCDVGVRNSITRSDGYRGQSLTPLVDGPNRYKRKRKRTKPRYARTFQGQVIAREARKAVLVALATGRGISLEDPTRLPKWGGWAARQFANRVELLSTLMGVPVRLLPPAWSSKTCSRCTSRDTFRHKTMFRCRTCGFTRHADENAALNIASGSYTLNGIHKGSLSLHSPLLGGGAVE